MEISLRANVKEIERKLGDLASRQLPFATATALTALAKDVKRAEDVAIEAVFDNPTPFTRRAVGIKPATKKTLTALVYVRDRQALYLAPEEFDIPQFLGAGRKIRTPVDIVRNSSGNIARGKIKALLARKDTFIGTVHGINGLWQRPYRRPTGSQRGQSRKKGLIPKGANTSGGLKLLVAFTRPKNVKTKFGYFARAEKIINANFNRRFGQALAKAIATSR